METEVLSHCNLIPNLLDGSNIEKEGFYLGNGNQFHIDCGKTSN
jgi:hypothetical protein